jgi:hypothetical protein
MFDFLKNMGQQATAAPGGFFDGNALTQLGIGLMRNRDPFQGAAEGLEGYQKARQQNAKGQNLIAMLNQSGALKGLDPGMQQAIASDPEMAQHAFRQMVQSKLKGMEPPEGLSAWQQAQLKLDQQRLGLDERRLAQAGAGNDIDLQMKQIELQRAQRPDAPQYKEINGQIIEFAPGAPPKVVDVPGMQKQSRQQSPVGYQWAEDGQSLEAIPGGPVDNRALTEQQTKDALFAGRMYGAEDEFDKLMQQQEDGTLKGYDPTKVPQGFLDDPAWSNAYIPAAINSNEWKRYNQAKRDHMAAILRKDTGAAITPGEEVYYNYAYYPQPGDDAATLKRKKTARESMAEAMGVGAGKGFEKMHPELWQRINKKRSGGSVSPGADKAAIIEQAKEAISQGADPEKIKARLAEQGIQY